MPKKIRSSFFQKTEKNKTNYRKKKLMPIFISLFLVIIFISIPVHEARAGLLDPLIDILAGGAGLIIYNVMNLALFVTVGIVHFGAYLVDIMTDPVLYETVLDSNSVAIRTGWTTIRDFCNMFFIFFLLVVAFATILRISAYSAKAILPKFLIAIFMINFSQEITKMVIDFGQVFMYEFISWMGGSFSGSGGGGTALTSIADFFYDKYHFGLQFSFDAVLSITFAVAYTFALGFIYIILAGFLLVRLIAFVVLIIFSPFAIFAMVFPGTRKYTSEWWSGLIKYTMFGPIFMFFVYLSSVMAMDLQSSAGLSASITGGGGYSGLSLGDILTELIPNVVALGLLLAAIPMSQKLGGIAGSAALTGGGLGGLGTAVMGSYGAAKLAGGWGKKIGGGAAERVHGTMMGNATYKAATDKISGKLKTNAITGRIALQYEADRAQKKKEDVAKHQKIMDNLSDKDKKSYVDSFSIDGKGKADAQQAMFNLLAKDSGKGLTDGRLQKIGYEKEVTLADGTKEKVFDRDKFESDYNRSKAYGHDTSTFEAYRPDMIKGKDVAETEKDKREKVSKIVHDGNYKSIKGDALADPIIEDELKKKIGRKKYDEFINNKSQEEKDSLAEHKEANLASKLASGPVPIDEVRNAQIEIASLVSSDKKEEAMKDVRLDVNGKIEYFGNVDVDIANKVMDNMSKDQFVDLSEEFLKKYGHLVSDSNIDHIARYGETEQLKAIQTALEDVTSATPTVGVPVREPIDPAKFDKRLRKTKSKI